ncbi:MAG: 3-isopropylmalate dehydratase large subunit [Candidatus Promineifilaceae bacterium]
MSKPRNLFEKIWDAHVVHDEAGSPTVLYIDLHLIHEVTSPQAFTGLREKGLKVRSTKRTIATMDHSIPTMNTVTNPDLILPMNDAQAVAQLNVLEKNCADFGVTLYDHYSSKRGIVHVIGPELGLTQPGQTIVCGDSHTSTHGAFGALAFGIGTSEIEHVLATQCLLQYKPKTARINFEGELQPGVTAKDMILALIAETGIGGGTGYVYEFAGSAVRNLSMEGRMTMCNMTIEGGARAGMVAADEKTYEWVKGREYAPEGEDWDKALERWKSFQSDEGATYDREITIDVSKLSPMITYGTNPGMGMEIDGSVPDPAALRDINERQSLQKAINYMDIDAGKPILGRSVDVVFVGSCTNSRMSDLEAAAELIKGRKVSDSVRMMIVPGSEDVRRKAEAQGLHKIFIDAGAEWRSAGCSMCIAMNGDQLSPGQYAVSTSNRNFEGRQGKGGRTFLASPLTAVASAVTGKVTDPRTLLD